MKTKSWSRRQNSLQALVTGQVVVARVSAFRACPLGISDLLHFQVPPAGVNVEGGARRQQCKTMLNDFVVLGSLNLNPAQLILHSILLHKTVLQD